MWAGNSDIVYYFDGSTWNYINITAESGFTTGNGNLSTIVQDDAGLFYLGFQSDGIVTWDGNSTWEHYTKSNGLTSNHILCGINDGTGKIWFGFESGGIMINQGGAWQSWTTWDGLTENNVYSIFEDSQEKVWMLTYNGISVLENEVWNAYQFDYSKTVSSGEIKENIDGNIVYSMKNYFNIFNGMDWEEVCGLSNVGTINDLICSGSDTVFLGHTNGFTRAIGPDWSFGSSWYNFTGLPNNWVYSLALWNNNIWIGTRDGLAYSNGSIVQQVQIPEEQIGNRIIDLAVDHENILWIATNEGAANYDGTNWNYFTENNGLIHNNLTCIEITQDNSVWFGSNAGACRLNDTEWFYFTEADSLIDNRVKCIKEDHLGNIWFGTWKGVTKMLADTTGTSNLISKKREAFISVYPNPCTDKLFIRLLNNRSRIDIALYDMAGNQIKKMKSTNQVTVIPTQDIKNGVYLLEVRSTQESTYKKIIIK